LILIHAEDLIKLELFRLIEVLLQVKVNLTIPLDFGADHSFLNATRLSLYQVKLYVCISHNVLLLISFLLNLRNQDRVPLSEERLILVKN